MSKKWNRHSDSNGELSDGSIHSCDVLRITDCNCLSIGKAVNFNEIKKCGMNIKCTTGCEECTSDSKQPKEEECAMSSRILICLECAHQGCGKKESEHALEHDKKLHCDSCHSIAGFGSSFWCFECAVEIQNETANVDKKEQKQILYNLPKVGGLMNLGNTCFFNAVLQCLAQTPFLVKVLEDLRLPGQKFVLPGGKHKPANSSEEVELPPIEGTLEGWGSFTSILCKTLIEMQNSDGRRAYRPSEILNSFKKKTMQCMDGGQHDSHELLRHLLELVRNEDLRRYQSIILKEVGLNGKTNPQEVENSLKSRVKFYGNQASARLLGPELVFRGVLVSTLECLDCHHTSQSMEPFLDLSIPVMADKPQPPVLKRKNSGFDDTFNVMGNNISHTPSKYQLKKEKKPVRKNRKNRKQENRNHDNDDNFISDKNNIAEENNGSIRESEKGDADVEDNVEADHFSTKMLPGPGPMNTCVTNSPQGKPLDELDSSESVENESGIQTGSSFATSLVMNSDLTSPTVPTISLSSVTSKESPNSPVSGVTNGENLENIKRPLSRLNLIEPVGPNEQEEEEEAIWDDWKARRKTEEYSNEVSNGINGITSEISKIGISCNLQQSPTRYPTKEGEYSIQSCLNQFTALELMSGSNKVGCEACTAREKKVKENCKMVCTPSTKQYLISRVPAVLIFHLKRFQAQRTEFRKVSRHVSFPTLLDLAPICKNHKKPRVYALYGVVEHSGTIRGGHYVAYVKSRLPLKPDDPRWSFLPPKDPQDTQENSCSSSSDSETEEATATLSSAVKPPPGKWYLISDSRVSEVDEKTVLQSQAYLLFYERIF